MNKSMAGHRTREKPSTHSYMACDLKRGQRGLQAELSTLACKLITQLASRCRAEARARRSLLTLSKISPCMFRHNPAQLTVVPLIETPGVDNGPRRRLADCMCFLNVLQRSDDRNRRTELSVLHRHRLEVGIFSSKGS